MNKANKIDARYSVGQAINRNGQGYLRSLNNSSLGLSEKDITCILYFQRVKHKNGETMLRCYCFSMEKLKT